MNLNGWKTFSKFDETIRFKYKKKVGWKFEVFEFINFINCQQFLRIFSGGLWGCVGGFVRVSVREVWLFSDWSFDSCSWNQFWAALSQLTSTSSTKPLAKLPTRPYTNDDDESLWFYTKLQNQNYYQFNCNATLQCCWKLSILVEYSWWKPRNKDEKQFFAKKLNEHPNFWLRFPSYSLTTRHGEAATPRLFDLRLVTTSFRQINGIMAR